MTHPRDDATWTIGISPQGRARQPGAPDVPEQIGHYRVHSLLGHGGMGYVYLASDTKLGRAVAVKFLPAAPTGDASAQGRLEREARAVAALNHPAICAIYSIEEHAETPFLVLEYIPGKSLHELIEHPAAGWPPTPAAARGEHARIEEHGLHIWMGFYENAFRIMRQVYEQNKVNRPPGLPLREWTDAFHEHSLIALMDHPSPEDWQVWPIQFPAAEGTPGDGRPITLWDALAQLLKWLQSVYLSSDFHQHHGEPVDDPGFAADVRSFFSGARREVPFIAELMLSGQIELIKLAAEALQGEAALRQAALLNLLGGLLGRFRDSLRAQIRPDVAAGNVDSRRTYEVMDLGVTVAKGLLEGGYLFDHSLLDRLHEDFEEWLVKEGADPTISTTAGSAVVRGLYDLVFAYVNGDAGQPSFEAGVAIRSVLLIVGAYKGAIFWKMQAGMGDVVFGPMYQVLKDKVKFEFFHRVEELVLNADGMAVDSVRLGVQATLKDPQAGYNPLITCRQLPAWPNQPRYEQLVEGDQLKAGHVNLESFWSTWRNPASRTLRAGQDFDTVVLAISLGALPSLFARGAPVPVALGTMMQKVATVRTQTFQLWVNKTQRDLGWTLGDVVLDAYTDPLNTWATMDQLLAREDWPRDMVKGLHYFCGQMMGGIPPQGEAGAPAMAYREVVANAQRFIENDLPRLWPGMKSGDFQIVSDFFRANIDPSDRYVQSVAESTGSRLRANESGLANVVLAGDWTKNGFNAGCVEAAVMSGIQAANAIAGRPLDEGIDGPLKK